jgi:hypothetical protein
MSTARLAKANTMSTARLAKANKRGRCSEIRFLSRCHVENEFTNTVPWLFVVRPALDRPSTAVGPWHWPRHRAPHAFLEATSVRSLSPKPQAGTAGASDWASLHERMRFIIDLFRTAQQDVRMFEQPFSAAQRGELEARCAAAAAAAPRRAREVAPAE